MRDRDLYRQAYAILAAVGRRIGTPVDDALLLWAHSNTIFALPSVRLLVRIATNPEALPRVRASVDVTRWLAARGFPCVVPADILDQPFVEQGRVISVWCYLPTVAEPSPSGADLGRLLRVLHSQPPPDPPVDRFGDPFASVSEAVNEIPDAVSTHHRRWLVDRIAELREAWYATDFVQDPGLIHGDAHTNNLMRTESGKVILGDWDHVALGPREWDLAQVHYTHRRFGRPAAADLAGFSEAYGWDVRGWPGLDFMVTVREITGLSAYIRTVPTKAFSRHELVRRLDTLRRRDDDARWDSPPRA
ncbi:MAG: aminoglycoside phosphotransferase family protein [Carbonactinosporaceae bacterium]